jgi:hypothetical protein
MQTNFADTILNISVTGGLVRIDLGTVVPAPTDENPQALKGTQTQQLVMPLDGFINAFNTQESLVKKLVADGVLKVQQPVGTVETSGQVKAS